LGIAQVCLILVLLTLACQAINAADVVMMGRWLFKPIVRVGVSP
jgi:hypothetical protein